MSAPLVAADPIAMMSFTHSITEKRSIDHFPLTITVCLDGFTSQAELIEVASKIVDQVSNELAIATEKPLDQIKPSERKPEGHISGRTYTGDDRNEVRIFKESYVFELEIPAGEDPITTSKHVAALTRQLEDLSRILSAVEAGKQSAPRKKFDITVTGQTGEISSNAFASMKALARQKARAACIQSAFTELQSYGRDPNFFHIIRKENGDQSHAKRVRLQKKGDEEVLELCFVKSAEKEVTLARAKEVSHTETLSIDVGAVPKLSLPEREMYYGRSIQSLYYELHPEEYSSSDED